MRKSRRLLLVFMMLVAIALGAGLFFVIGTTATQVAEEKLPKPSPTPTPLDVFFGDLQARSLLPANLKLVASGFKNPHGIGIFDGTLYVSDWGDNKLYAVNPETGDKRLLADELGGVHDMVQDKDGSLVVPLYKEGRVVRVNPDTGEVKQVARGLKGPNGIVRVRGGDGYYVSNAKSGTVVQVRQDGSVRVIIRGLKEPAGLVVDNENIIRVAQYADPVNSVVQVLDNGKRSTVVRNLANAESLLYDQRKNLLIGNVRGGRGVLTLFTARGKFSHVLQTDLPGPLIGPVTDGKYLYIQSAAPGQTAVYRIALP